MKCVILAGGAGDRLWPLSRKNYPKQFLSFHSAQSLFQETITRNIPFCKEFVILTNQSYATIVQGQLQTFQGLSYRVVVEEEGRGTAASILSLCGLLGDSEEIFVTPSDLSIDSDGYSDAIYEAKEIAARGQIVLFGVRPESPRTSVGYLRCRDTEVTRFIEKPTAEVAEKLYYEDNMLWNSGLFLCKVESLRKELRRYLKSPLEHAEQEAKQFTETEGHQILLPRSYMEALPQGGIDRLLFEQSDALGAVRLRGKWRDVSDLQSLYAQYEQSEAPVITNQSSNVDVLNEDPSRLVVTNGISDAYVVNTPDAVYITSKNHMTEIKDILREYGDTYADFFENSPKTYRPWGTREIIRQESGYRLRKIVMYPGGTMSFHAHEQRTESYTVVSGVLSVQLEEQFYEIQPGDHVSIAPGQRHRLFNNGDTDAVFIEVDTGSEIAEQDMLHPAEALTTEDKLPDVFRLSPAFKDYLWGGNRLVSLFHKASPYDITAESWELSAHPDGQSVIADGAYAGMKFGEFVHRYGSVACGWKSETFDRFPVLIKFIDAKNALSIQIHPDDDYAFVNEGEFGKNEVWYVMDAEPGAYLYCGLSRDVDKEELERRIADNTLTEVLNRVDVHTGDVVFVPAGTIHAIGAGILICEIQQNSNSTYRMFDYGRRDKNGNLRELHVEKALDVVNTHGFSVDTSGFQPPVEHDGYTQQLIVQCKYFQCNRYHVDTEATIAVDDASFKSIIVLSGEGRLRLQDTTYDMHPGDSFFVTAGRKLIHIYGPCEIIVTNV